LSEVLSLGSPGGAADKYVARLAALKTERSQREVAWRELDQYLLPGQARFTPGDHYKDGTRRDQSILRNDAGKALSIGTKGLMSGVTPPTREWFGLATPDPDLMEFHPVKVWLEKVEERINWALHKSTFYVSMFGFNRGLFAWGTSAMVMEEDAQRVIRTALMPIGSFYFAVGPDLTVDTMYREFTMSVQALVRRFGKSNCSLSVQGMWNSGNYEARIPVVHAVQPRLDNRYAGRAGNKNMPFESCWFEAGGGDNGRLLAQSGFAEFPVIPGRWDVVGDEAYGGTWPGLDALGDIKGLQLMERKSLNMIAKMADPSMVVPSELEIKPGAVNLLPGGSTFVGSSGAGKQMYPAHEIDPNGVKLTEEKMTQAVQRIYGHFYADLFTLITEAEREGEKATAAEIYAKLDERAQQLGPVLHRMESESLTRVIDRAFSICQRQGLLPPPPPEIAGQELKVEFKSVLHQAQGASGATGIANVSAWALQFAEVKPDVLDKLDTDRMVDELARAHGVPADCIVPKEEVQRLRQERAAQQQAMQAESVAKAAQAGSQAAKNLSEIDMTQGGDTALGRMMGEVA
jgi:hypothetical protein